MTAPTLSLIIAVYERPDVLEKVLRSVAAQTIKDFELVIADDGSGSAVRDLLAGAAGTFRHPIQHVWQENQGFRKTLIANQAVRASRSDYLVFIDGDCVLHHRFLEQHLARARPGVALAGRRVKFDRELTARVTLEDIADRRLERPGYWRGHTERGSARSGHYRPWLFQVRNLMKRDYTIVGSNFSLHKTDFLRVNGYDERVIGRGLEDDNLCARLKMVGIRIGYITNEALQYHLHHDANPIPHTPDVIREFKNPPQAYTPFGLVKAG